MTSLTKTFAWISFIGGILLGIIDGMIAKHNILTALYWWVGGIFLCVIFVTFTCLLEYIEALHMKLDALLSKHPVTESYPEKGKTTPKRSLESIQDFKLPKMD